MSVRWTKSLEMDFRESERNLLVVGVTYKLEGRNAKKDFMVACLRERLTTEDYEPTKTQAAELMLT